MKADKAHVAVVLKDVSEFRQKLRQKLQNETQRYTKLLDEDKEIVDDDEAKEKQMQNDDSIIRKLQGELSRVKARLHTEKYDDESELRQQLQNETQHETKLLDAKEWQLEKKDSSIHKLKGELSQVEAKLHAEEANDALTTRKTVSGDEAELRRERKTDSQKIGSLEGELEVNTDEESILQQKFTETQAKLLLLQQQGNYSNVHELQAKLKAARNQIQKLVLKLDKKDGELAVKQDEMELESANSGKGAAIQEEVDVLRQKVRKMLEESVDMTTKFEKEHDKREVAEAMVAELQKMVTGEQDKLSHIKGKLWKSQLRVGRLRKELSHT